MFFRTLQLTHFRNYSQAQLELGPGLNCLTGLNGQGKTNVLEALHLLCTTRGFHAEKDLQQQGADHFRVSATVESDSETLEVACAWQAGRAKLFQVNGLRLPRMSDHVGKLPIVTLLPDDVQLVQEGGSERRRWMDAFLCQWDRTYLQGLQQYEKALEQRNALLKQAAETGEVDDEMLDLWTRQLVYYALPLRSIREQFVAALRPVLVELHTAISRGTETPEIVYQSAIAENAEPEWLAVMAARHRRDTATGTTSAGLHRDDLDLTLNGLAVRNFGSQGQQKSYLLALKLALHHLLEVRTGRPPLLLLDDVFDKLDPERMLSIMALLARRVQGQVLLTDTSRERLQQAVAPAWQRHQQWFRVQAGNICIDTPSA